MGGLPQHGGKEQRPGNTKPHSLLGFQWYQLPWTVVSKHHRRWLQRQTCPLTAWRLEAESPRSRRAGLFLPRAEGDLLQAPLLSLVASGVPRLAGGVFCLCMSTCRFPLVIRTQSPHIWPALPTSSQLPHLRRPHFQTRSHSQVLGVTTSGGGLSTQTPTKRLPAVIPARGRACTQVLGRLDGGVAHVHIGACGEDVGSTGVSGSWSVQAWASLTAQITIREPA